MLRKGGHTTPMMGWLNSHTNNSCCRQGVHKTPTTGLLKRSLNDNCAGRSATPLRQCVGWSSSMNDTFRHASCSNSVSSAYSHRLQFSPRIALPHGKSVVTNWPYSHHTGYKRLRRVTKDFSVWHTVITRVEFVWSLRRLLIRFCTKNNSGRPCGSFGEPGHTRHLLCRDESRSSHTIWDFPHVMIPSCGER